MFIPDCNPDMISPIRPGSHEVLFGNRELTRMCISMLQEAKDPVRFDITLDRVIEGQGVGGPSSSQAHGRYTPARG